MISSSCSIWLAPNYYSYYYWSLIVGLRFYYTLFLLLCRLYDIGEASRNGLMVEKLLWESEAVWTFPSVSCLSLMVLEVLDDDKYFNHDVAMMILNLFSTVITPSPT